MTARHTISTALLKDTTVNNNLLKQDDLHFISSQLNENEVCLFFLNNYQAFHWMSTPHWICLVSY